LMLLCLAFPSTSQQPQPRGPEPISVTGPASVDPVANQMILMAAGSRPICARTADNAFGSGCANQLNFESRET
jgi:hypothetical protein